MQRAGAGALVSAQGRAAGRRGDPHGPGQLHRRRKPCSGGTHPRRREASFQKARRPGRSRRPQHGPCPPQPRTPAPAPQLRPPRPAQGERPAVTVSTHSSRGLSGIQQPASAQAHTLPSPAPSLPALGTSRTPFAPPSGPPQAAADSRALAHPHMAGGGRLLRAKPPARNYTLPWYSPWLCWISAKTHLQ